METWLRHLYGFFHGAIIFGLWFIWAKVEGEAKIVAAIAGGVFTAVTILVFAFGIAAVIFPK